MLNVLWFALGSLGVILVAALMAAHAFNNHLRKMGQREGVRLQFYKAIFVWSGANIEAALTRAEQKKLHAKAITDRINHGLEQKNAYDHMKGLIP